MYHNAKVSASSGYPSAAISLAPRHGWLKQQQQNFEITNILPDPEHLATAYTPVLLLLLLCCHIFCFMLTEEHGIQT